MNKQVEKEITKIYNAVYKKILTPQNVKALREGDKSKILSTFASFTTSEKYEQFANEFSKRLAKMGIGHEKGLWKKFYKVAKETHNVALPYSYSEYEKQVYTQAVKHNFLLIKSIPRHVLDVIEEKAIATLITEVADGKLPRGAFKKELDKHGSKNAKLIARTETSKLQSAITETRATSIGSVAYEWIASNDKRTRPSHKEMDGVIVFWRPDAEKPLRDKMRGNAGEFPNCRCYPSPIFDESDLKKSSYEVYDYRTDKITRMNKRDLIKALQNKYL